MRAAFAVRPGDRLRRMNERSLSNAVKAALAAAVTGMSKRDLKIVNEIAADLPELQTRIKRAVFLSALGLV